MSQASAPTASSRAADPAALARWARRLAGTEPWLHAEVGRRLAEKLSVVRLQPRRALDWGWGADEGLARLRQPYPRADVQAVADTGLAAGSAGGAARPLPPWWSPARWRPREGAVVPSEVPSGSAQLVWSNMWLHAQADPLQVFRSWHAALAVDGFLMFSTLGPGTLDGLRALYAEHGWPPPHAPFVDMHDLGDMLVAAGFADPVMDQETLTLTWSDGKTALNELQTLGCNASPGRPVGLRTPRWQRGLSERLSLDPRTRDGDRVALRFEVVYGHAFKPLPRPRVAPQSTVGLEDMRSILRGRPEG